MKQQQNSNFKQITLNFFTFTYISLSLIALCITIFFDSSYLLASLFTIVASITCLVLNKYDKNYKYTQFIIPNLVIFSIILPLPFKETATAVMMYSSISFAAILVSNIYENLKCTLFIIIDFISIYVINLILYNVFGFSFLKGDIFKIPLIDILLFLTLIAIVSALSFIISKNNLYKSDVLEKEVKKANDNSSLANETVAKLEDVKGQIVNTISDINNDSLNLQTKASEINELFTNITNGIINQNDNLQDIASNFNTFNSLVDK
ncbi:MAG: hypothetical protein IJH34_03985, partial [Romboutsia sp.]|nr:hypothetical protein [Romboutsia sp.]